MPTGPEESAVHSVGWGCRLGALMVVVAGGGDSPGVFVVEMAGGEGGSQGATSVVGGGLAGGRACQGIRRLDKEGSINAFAAGYTPGDDVALALDCASTEYFKKGKYEMEGEGKSLSPEQHAQFLRSEIAEPPRPLDALAVIDMQHVASGEIAVHRKDVASRDRAVVLPECICSLLAHDDTAGHLKAVRDPAVVSAYVKRQINR